VAMARLLNLRLNELIETMYEVDLVKKNICVCVCVCVRKI
jgi:hypothetical protein